MVLAIIAELVNLLICVLTILVHFGPFWLTAFILVHFGKLGSSYFWLILVNCDNFGTF